MRGESKEDTIGEMAAMGILLLIIGTIHVQGKIGI